MRTSVSGAARALLAASVVAGWSALAQAAPVSQRYVWGNVPIGGGGYVLDVVCQPRQKDLVYIRTDVGGFYRWDSRMQGWSPMTEAFDSTKSNYYGGEGLAVDPFDADTVYIAAGKYEWAAPGSIFKSSDQGRSWRKLPIDVAMGGNEDHRWGGERLALSPLHRGVLLFGSRKDGLWRSVDGGASWQKATAFSGALKPGMGINAVAFSPAQAGVVYASAFGDGVYESRDDGLTWTRTAGGPKTPERLACGGDGVLYATHSQGVARFENGVWQDVTPAGAGGAYCGLSVDPADPHDVICTMTRNRLRLFRSRDAGSSWTEKTVAVSVTPPWYSSLMRQIQYPAGLTFDPCVTGRIWVTDWYATYHADSIDSDPVNLVSAERGHEEVVTFDLAAPNQGPDLISGVADVDGFVHDSLGAFPTGLGSFYGGHGPSFGDTTQIAACLSQSSRLVRASSNRWNSDGGVSFSSDGGHTWVASNAWPGGKKPMRVAMSAANPEDVVALPVGPGETLYTRDGGKSWNPATGLPADLTHGDVWNWQFPLAADGAVDGAFYVYAHGQVYRSVDGGASFQPAASGLPQWSQATVTVPGRAGDVWLVMGGHGLLHSTDGAQSFRTLESVKEASLFAVGVRAPGGSYATLYLYGSLADGRKGIFRSTDAGRTWLDIQQPGMPIGDEPCCMTASLKTFGLVFIGTNGRGVYYGREGDRMTAESRVRAAPANE